MAGLRVQREIRQGNAAPSARKLPISGFGGGTLITTVDGVVPVDWLRPNDEVLTFDGQARPVRWVGRDCMREPPQNVAAVEIDALGEAERSPITLLAARHRVVLTGWQIELNFGLDAVLAEAGQIAHDSTHFPAPKNGATACSFVLLDAPEIIQADGFWVETLQLTDSVYDCMTKIAREAIRHTQPDLTKHQSPRMASLHGWEATELGLDLDALIAREALQLKFD